MDIHTDPGADPFSGREKAIRNMGGMVWLYEKHLAKFLITYADSPETIRILLMQGDLQTARILTHSIKGLSGTLGMDRLYAVSGALEKAIIDRSCNISTLLLDYESCINEIITYIQK